MTISRRIPYYLFYMIRFYDQFEKRSALNHWHRIIFDQYRKIILNCEQLLCNKGWFRGWKVFSDLFFFIETTLRFLFPGKEINLKKIKTIKKIFLVWLLLRHGRHSEERTTSSRNREIIVLTMVKCTPNGTLGSLPHSKNLSKY